MRLQMASITVTMKIRPVMEPTTTPPISGDGGGGDGGNGSAGGAGGGDGGDGGATASEPSGRSRPQLSPASSKVTGKHRSLAHSTRICSPSVHTEVPKRS